MKLEKKHFVAINTNALRRCLLAVMLICFSLSPFAQTSISVSGVVKDQQGDPLIGVSIRLENSKTGTITDINGNFTLVVPTKSSLTFSYVGYAPKTVLATQSQMNVILDEDNNDLDEVVVVGYGTVKKRDLTGAITSVKSDAITLTPSSNPMLSLQGRVAGLDITKSSGQAGTGVSMQLRGNRSFAASGTPLFIIDGMPGDYSTMNPNDIESIEILKDASSTAVYGSAGSNGVIIITTKKGKEGVMNVNFNTFMGYNGWSILPKMRSGDSYMNTIRLARQEAGTYIDDTDLVDPAIYEAYQKGQNIDWANALMQTGNAQNYSLSISNGTKKTKEYFSLNYSNENGQYTNDNYQVLSTNIRLDQQINKFIATGINVQGSYTMQNKTYSKIYNALVASPFGTLYDESGNLNPYPVVGDNKQVNLLLNQNKDAYLNNNQGLRLYVTPYIRISPVKGMTIESRLNGNLSFSNSHQFLGYGSYQFYDALGTGALNASDDLQKAQVSATIKGSSNYNYKWENILTYNFKIAKDHDFTFTGVGSYNSNQSESLSSSMTGITSNMYNWTNLGAGTGVPTVESGYTMSKGIGLMERISYSYLGRYLFSASMRQDASSRLAIGHRWSTFPAVSAGWRVSDESFMASTKTWLDNLKIRVGYGVTGTAGIDPYSSWSILQQGNLSLAGEKLTNYYYPQTVPNPDLSWERSYNTNIGLDMSFLNNRIDLSADYYITNTDGVIWTQAMPITGGGYDASSYYSTNANIASTKNQGIELALTTRNIVTKDFNWVTTITYSKNNEEVTSLGDGTQDYVTNGDYTLHVGSPIKSYYNYKVTGVWQNGEEADAAVFGAVPGDIKVDIPDLIKDSEGEYHKTIKGDDGTDVTTAYNAQNKYAIGTNDYQIIGHNSPDWSLGFQNTVTYKGFDFGIYMYARFGQTIDYSLLTAYNNSGTSNFPEYFNYWTSTNPSNDFPALNSSREIKQMTGYYALSFVDGSFFKIKNITMGYSLSKKWSKALKIEKLRVYGTLTNPLIIANSHLIKDYDPEMNGNLDFPSTKQLVFGLNLTF
ncbi:MAG: TonB-dependent receptor [Paludibacter sp.]|nr:TonB-dependent receptor [Paludibacter sp.]